MSGGLWRVDMDQLDTAAASGGRGRGDSAGAGAAVRGPHASLAVRVRARDAGRAHGKLCLLFLQFTDEQFHSIHDGILCLFFTVY